MLLGGDRPEVGGLPGLSWVWALGGGLSDGKTTQTFVSPEPLLETRPAKPSQFLEAGKEVAGLGAGGGS